MTIEELKIIKELLNWNILEEESFNWGRYKELENAKKIIQREINLKEMDPRLKTDVSGNSMNED